MYEASLIDGSDASYNNWPRVFTSFDSQNVFEELSNKWLNEESGIEPGE